MRRLPALLACAASAALMSAALGSWAQTPTPAAPAAQAPAGASVIGRPTAPAASFNGESADEDANPDKVSTSKPTGPAPAGAPGAMLGFSPPEAAAERDYERRFDALIDPAEMAGWLKRLASQPNHVGSPHDRDNAEWELGLFKSWGWDAHMETFQVLYPTPLEESLELVGPHPYRAKLHEPPVPGDATSAAPGQLPPYVAYQGDGDVTAELVYVNYGMPDDYKALARAGVDVRGKVVIARYGAGWRGLKPKLAQEHGAVGCLIYSDPADDGYALDDTYPKGAQRPVDGVQRGSVVDITTYPGDPLTPGVGAVAGVKRQYTRETAPTVLKIPALPISYGDAQPLLAALDGPVAEKGARGALGITYHHGPGPARVHLRVRSDWSLKTLYDVVAVMPGSEQPDTWLLRGNHRDGWVFGAEDPLSGQVSVMAEAKAIGALARQGLRPKRTLVYLSWDGEEPGLLGSTEWAEAHAVELQAKALAYVNSDNIDRGFLNAGGSQALTRLVNQVAAEVTDPQTHVSLRARQRARVETSAAEGGDPRAARLAKLEAAGGDAPLEALGSGSDYSSFLQHLGLASLDIRFGGEGESGGVYHSAYDTYEHYSRFGDPGEAYGATLARTAGRVMLRLADAPVTPMRFADTSATFTAYVADLKALTAQRRSSAAEVTRLLDTGAFQLAADPTKTSLPPQRPVLVPALDWSALDAATVRLKASAERFDAASGLVAPERRPAVNAVLQGLEQRLLDEGGLPGRPWYRNLAYAPGVLTGYGAKTFPGVREAVEGDRYDEAQRFIAATAAAVNRYSDGLDQATAAAGAPARIRVRSSGGSAG